MVVWRYGNYCHFSFGGVLWDWNFEKGLFFFFWMPFEEEEIDGVSKKTGGL